jgi:hypothetical protein
MKDLTPSTSKAVQYVAFCNPVGYLPCTHILFQERDQIIRHEADEATVVIEAWMLPLREKTVRKNLTIPARLALQAERAGINFSQVLSAALEKELRIDVHFRG